MPTFIVERAGKFSPNYFRLLRALKRAQGAPARGGAVDLEWALGGEVESRVILAARHLHQAHHGVEEVVVREVAARRQLGEAVLIELESGGCRVR